ncbi:MAG TPA: n-acetylglutamate synthase [Spirochaetia bacterium]|nr:n-acetylglutamate synthase [Spirochaetia bacterium]
MNVNLNGRTFHTAENTSNGEVGRETVFHYHQNDRMVWAEYAGGVVVSGHLLAVVADDGTLDMRYHHINEDGEVLAGTCRSRVVELPDGRCVLEEEWQWLTGDRSSGTSRVEEIRG